MDTMRGYFGIGVEGISKEYNLGNLSPDMLSRCDFTVKIPLKFCVNVGVAGALIMYDRMMSMGRYAGRPMRAGGPALPEEGAASMPGSR